MEYGFAVFAGTPPAIIRATARAAETAGYHSFWTNHPGRLDGLAALAKAAAATSTIDLGVGVIPLQTRGAAEIIDGVQENALPSERLLVGVGSANPDGLRRLREGIATLRQGTKARIVAAALGPQMCRLAGSLADGVLLNWLTPEYARRSADEIRTGAEAAGRPMPKIYAYVRLAMGEAGAAKLAQEASNYASIPSYAANFARQGVDAIDTAICASSPEEVAHALEAWQGAVDAVIFRAVPGDDSVEEHLRLVAAAAPR